MLERQRELSMLSASAMLDTEMRSPAVIDILLACYNGERYLAAQLDSLLAQTDNDWRLLVHDDGSSDGTQDIVRRYQSLHKGKIEFIEDGARTGGAKNNFAHLMALCSADYIMFCDQDDVWYPEKIARSRQRMEAAQQRYPAAALLVHSDLEVVDAELRRIAPSMFDYQRMTRHPSFEELLVQNNVTGCTAMINRTALLAAMPMPRQAIMHDWWLALVVANSGGELLFIDAPLIKYRQHGGNSIGSKKVDFHYFLLRLVAVRDVLMVLRGVYSQAALLDRRRSYGLRFLMRKLWCVIRRV